jgi:RHS repeat-associated protein
MGFYYQDTEDPLQEWHAEFDLEGNPVVYYAKGCSGGCSGGAEYENIEYYNSSDERYNGVIWRYYNADDDIVLQNNYTLMVPGLPSDPDDPNYVHLPKPLLTSQFAQKGGQTVKFLDRGYCHADAVTNYCLEKNWVDASNYRLVKYYYANETFSRIVQKLEYETLNDDPNTPTGDIFVTNYDYIPNGSGYTLSTLYPSGDREDVQVYDSDSFMTQSYLYDTVSEESSRVESYTYDNDGYLATHTDARGGQSQYDYSDELLQWRMDVYNTQGVENPHQRIKTVYTYDGARRVKTEEEFRCDQYGSNAERIKKTTYYYGDTAGSTNWGRLTHETVAYDWQGSAYTQSLTTSYRYSPLGQQTRIIQPDGVVTGSHYNTAGQLESYFMLAGGSDPNDADDTLTLISQTKYEYNEEGRIEAIERAKHDGEFTFDSGSITWLRTEYQYDFLGRRTAVIEDAGGESLVTSYQYNNQGEITKTTVPHGKWTSTERDGRGLVTKEKVGYGETLKATTEFEYDANGNITKRTNPDSTEIAYDYDNLDQLEKVTQGNQVTVYTYDTAGQVTKEVIEDPNGLDYAVTEYCYDKLGRRWMSRQWADAASRSDANDRITLNAYDVSGNLVKMILKAPGSANDPNGMEPNDIVTENTYDALGHLLQLEDVQGNITTYTYDQGRLFKVEGPQWDVTRYYYDAAGRRIITVDGEGHYHRSYYDSLGQVITEIAYELDYCPIIDDPNDPNYDPYYEDDPNNYSYLNFSKPLVQSRREYDGAGHLTRQAIMADAGESLATAIDTAVDMVTDYDYDPNGADYPGLLVSETRYYGGANEYEAVTDYEYDGLGRRTWTMDPEDNETYLTYDSMNRITRQLQVEKTSLAGEDNLILTTDFVYDSRGRLYQQRQLPDPNDPNTWLATTFTYDILNHQIQSTDAKGVITKSFYDDLGTRPNRTKVIADYGTGKLNQTTEFGFDRLGRQITITGSQDETDPNTDQTTSYSYDKLYRVVKVIYPDSSFLEYEYDKVGNVSKRTDRRGWITLYEYDDLGRQTGKSAYDPNEVLLAQEEFTFDGLGRILAAEKIVDANSVSLTEFGYNDFGLLASEETSLWGGDAKRITYLYDQAGFLVKRDNVDIGEELIYSRDGLGRIDTITRDNGIIDPFTFAEYDYLGAGFGRIQQIEFDRANLTCSAEYDNYGRITRCLNDPNDPNETLDFQYDYDNVGNRTQVKYNHLATAKYDRYTLDNLRRLTKAEYGKTSGWSLNLKILPLDFGPVEIEQMDEMQLMMAAARMWLATDVAGFDCSQTCLSTTDQNTINRLEDVILHKLMETQRRQMLSGIEDDQTPIIQATVISAKDEKGYTVDFLLDEDGGLIGKTITDTAGQNVYFALYLDDGGKAVIETEYDTGGNMESEVYTLYDGDDNIVDQMDMLEEKEKQTAALTAASLENAEDLVGLEGGMMMCSSAPEAPSSYYTDFDYDDLGNRTVVYSDFTWGFTQTDTYSSNQMNQYTQIDDPNHTLDYDTGGNLSRDTTDYHYHYDYENRLTEIRDANDVEVVVEFEYDALGRRVYKNDKESEIEMFYYYDKDYRVIAEYQLPPTYIEPMPYRIFVYGNGIDEVLAMYEPGRPMSGDPNDLDLFYGMAGTWLLDPNDPNFDGTYDYDQDNFVDYVDVAEMAKNWTFKFGKQEKQGWYYLKDALGSVMGIVSNDETQESEFYLYDAYGLPSGTSEVGNPYMFTSRRIDLINDWPLQFNRNRYYDYYTGRWLTPDSFGIIPNAGKPNRFKPLNQYKDGLSLYEYVRSMPIMRRDLYGLVCTLEFHKDNEETKILGLFSKPAHYWLKGHEDSGHLWDFGPDISDIWAQYYKSDPNISYDKVDFSMCGILHPCKGEANWSNNSYANQIGEAALDEVELRKAGVFQRGDEKVKGKSCECATCDDIYNCLNTVRSEWDNTPYDHWFRNCRTFVYDAMKKCCLRREKYKDPGPNLSPIPRRR